MSVLRLQFSSQIRHGTAVRDRPRQSKGSNPPLLQTTYTQGGIDLGHRLLVGRELVDLDAVADQLAHDFTLELVQLVFCNGVSLGNGGDDVHLQDRTAPPHTGLHRLCHQERTEQDMQRQP